MGNVFPMPETSFSAPHRRNPNRSGILQFMTPDLFSNPPAEQQLGIEKVDSWQDLETVHRRGDLYLIEASTPDLRLKLRFNPASPANGDYEIRPTRGEVERGRTETIKQTGIHATDLRFAKLAKYPVRYQLTTISSESPHSKKVWILGFDDAAVKEEEPTKAAPDPEESDEEPGTET